MQKKITVLLPLYNEAGNIYPLIKAIQEVFLLQPGYEYEILFADDGSTDESLLQVRHACKENNQIKYISFSRNFGKDNALLAGFQYASGDAVITMDADMQHPASLIKDFISAWENGFEVVYCYRNKKNEHVNFVSHFFPEYFIKSSMPYLIFN